MDRPTQNVRRRLGAAHLALGLWVLAASIGAAAAGQNLPPQEQLGGIASAARAGFWCGIGYGVVTALVHLGTGLSLVRHAARLACGGWLAAGHGVVFASVAAISLRNPKSTVFLAGLEDLIAMLMTTSLVCAFMWLYTARRQRRSMTVDEIAATPRPAMGRLMRLIQWGAVIAVVGALMRVDAYRSSYWPQ